MSGIRTPREALERLQDGNRRFRSDARIAADLTHTRRLEIAREQRPFATLVGCSDSRVGPELLFGAGLGELFIVRNAGSTVGAHALGSVEYSVAALQVPLVVVLGHERCGAVMAAVDRLAGLPGPGGAIDALVDDIVPAVRGCMGSATGEELLERAVRANVAATVARLRASTEPIMRDARERGELWIVGAYYDLESGRVDFFDLDDGG